jgi:hypothetical protein
MAVGEPRKEWQITQVSWTDGTTQDVYYWQEHSFQYSANINCDDEMHWIKLASKAIKTSSFAKCDLVSWGDYGVYALPVEGWDVKLINCNGSSITGGNSLWSINAWVDVVPWTIFQDFFWFWVNTPTVWGLHKLQNGSSSLIPIAPYDHPDYTDEVIWDASTKTLPMGWAITAILNYNNTRLVVATRATATSNAAVWVYYPELDATNPRGINWDEHATPAPVAWETGWKKVLDYEAWVTIVALTCTFEYLKVWAVDEGWSTKVYYYQGNNNLRSTFVYNVVDLTGERVLRAYSINGMDYFITSIDGTDGYVNLNKMIGNVAVPLFHQRAWLTQYDINTKAPYFVWPTGIKAAYKSGRFYIADAYGVFQFKYTPQSYDRGYMKWLLRNNKQVYWVCENKGFLYVSYEDGCCAMRLYDTWVDGYQDEWVLISREYEGSEWGTITKMLDEIRLNYEMNPHTNQNGSIDVYVSPNNTRWDTHTFTEANWWYHAMHIDQTNAWTRTEKSNLFNDMWGNDGSSFRFDWQTITYAIVINLWNEDEATPIVRQIDIKYHTKDKVNKVYTIK